MMLNAIQFVAIAVLCAADIVLALMLYLERHKRRVVEARVEDEHTAAEELMVERAELYAEIRRHEQTIGRLTRNVRAN